eukprot:6189831-Pleurochrysis_carterae.AAC.1
MVHHYQLKALDRTLRDLMSHELPQLADLPFGNKTILLAGAISTTHTIPFTIYTSQFSSK